MIFLNQQKYWNWEVTQLREIPCPVCGYEHYKSIYSRPDGLDIVSCQSCSFRFVQPQPSPEELNRFYQQGYFSGNHDFHQNTNYFESRKKGIETEQVTGWKFLKNQVDLSDKKLLDLGCADGALLVLARQYGTSKVVGVEFSNEAADYGRHQYNLEILNASADNLPCTDQNFDIVTAFDLIEHVTDPSNLFKEVSRVLCNGGIFLGSCPDMGCFDNWGAEWIGVQRNMEHLSYFDSNTLSKLAEKSGFRVILLEYQGFPIALKKYRNFQVLSQLSIADKLLQPDIWSYNIWQKLRVKLKQSAHLHELMFILEKV
ncbi:MAG: class I SAM-dependent methyltransferase [Cuspidothrix sp.]|jgi:spore maturation protein CgeB